MTNSPEIPDGSFVKENLTTDLVRRLRSENSMPPYYSVPKLQVEAAAKIERLRLALKMFMGAAYPVADEINKRGYNWSEAYLDEALAEARTELAQGGDK